MLTEDQRNRLIISFRRVVGTQESLSCRQVTEIASETNLPLREVECFALQEGMVPARYDRNIGTLGLDGQRKLLESRVIVVGLGGLGGHVVETLARLGVARIVGVDGDRFAETDLNRQLLSSLENLGECKAGQAGLRVSRINPAVEFAVHTTSFERLDEQVFRDCDMVFDCLDSIPARRVLAERCASADVVLVHGAIAGWCGQVSICPPGSGILDKVYAGNEVGIEQQVGNLPFTAAVAANLMVAKAVPLLLGQPLPSGQQLQFFDLREGDWETIDL